MNGVKNVVFDTCFKLFSRIDEKFSFILPFARFILSSQNKCK